MLRPQLSVLEASVEVEIEASIFVPIGLFRLESPTRFDVWLTPKNYSQSATLHSSCMEIGVSRMSTVRDECEY